MLAAVRKSFTKVKVATAQHKHTPAQVTSEHFLVLTMIKISILFNSYHSHQTLTEVLQLRVMGDVVVVDFNELNTFKNKDVVLFVIIVFLFLLSKILYLILLTVLINIR